MPVIFRSLLDVKLIGHITKVISNLFAISNRLQITKYISFSTESLIIDHVHER